MFFFRSFFFFRMSFPLLADDVVLLVSAINDLQLSLHFAAECEVARMKNSTSKPESVGGSG